MQLTYLEAIRQGIWEEMDRDPSVFCLGEDIGIYGGAFKVTDGFIDRFGPERVIDTPIAESAIVGAAFGASLTGMRPVAEFQFMDFIGCAFNQISNMVAKTHYLWGAPAPLVLRGPSGGYVHGGPFHSQNPEMWFVHNPGLKVICPATPYDAKGLIKAAIRDNNPCIFFEHKYLYRRIKGEVPAEDYVVPIGKANIVREGRDLSIITYAAMVHTALEAAEILAKENIDIEILDLRTVSPLDREAIAQTVKKTNKVIILHEHSRTGGLAGEIAAIINEEAFDDLDGPIVRIAGLDSAVPFSPPQEASLPAEGRRHSPRSTPPESILTRIAADAFVRSQKRRVGTAGLACPERGRRAVRRAQLDFPLLCKCFVNSALGGRSESGALNAPSATILLSEVPWASSFSVSSSRFSF